MRKTGITRPVDNLGRVVLPVEMRRRLDIEKHDTLEIFVDGASIVLRKHEAACILCNGVEQMQQYKGQNLCASCLKALKKL